MLRIRGREEGWLERLAESSLRAYTGVLTSLGPWLMLVANLASPAHAQGEDDPSLAQRAK